MTWKLDDDIGFSVIGLFNIKRQYYILGKWGKGMKNIFLNSKDFSNFEIEDLNSTFPDIRLFLSKTSFYKLLATNSQWARLISYKGMNSLEKKDEHQNQSGHDFEDIYGHFYSGSGQNVTTRGQ